jgi:hypothetical protein
MRCPSCDHDNRAERRFCAECGAALSIACPSCGAPVEAGEKFCGGCGAQLPTDAPAIAVSTPDREPEAALPAGERRQLTVLSGTSDGRPFDHGEAADPTPRSRDER